MHWFILSTDFLLYLLFGMLILTVMRVLKNPVLRQQMKGVLCRPMNFAAFYLLVLYLIVGGLDSIHFEITNSKIQAEYPNSVISVLDMALKPALTHSEKTYSEPFALYGFAKETLMTEAGEFIQDYPRLKYAGAHLKSPDERGQDIRKKLQILLFQGLLLAVALSVVFSWICSWFTPASYEVFLAQIFHSQTKFPFKTFFILLGMTIVFLLFIDTFMPLYHILGTGKVGEDVLYQTLKSIRTGIVIGTLTTLIMLPFATLLGVMAGYFRGWVDDVIQYTYTTLSSIPGVLLIAAAVLTLQAVMARHTDWFQTLIERSDARLLALCAILGITSWTGLCRLLRGETLKIREIEYVQAARSLGLGDFKIILRHIIPNLMHILLISVALDFSGLVLAEAVLSYVGVGVDPTTYSWGTMINGARLEMARMPMVWWSLVSAFIFMFILVLSANIFADALRDSFDPRMQQGGRR